MVVNTVSITSLTVILETDADTVAHYPTFVWLDQLTDHITHVYAASVEYGINLGSCSFCGENILFREGVRASVHFQNVSHCGAVAC